jgi:multiple sugar transport system permease protein
LIRPALISASIFSFSLAWSEFFYALILSSNQAKTLTVATVEYQAELVQYWSYSAAAVVGIIIPAILILVFVQRYFVKGLVLGAVKG